MPTTLSTTTSAVVVTAGVGQRPTTAAKPAWSASSGVMSLKTTPGSGKSGTSTTSRSSARRRPRRVVAHFLPRLDRVWRVGCTRPADAARLDRPRGRGTTRPAAAASAPGGGGGRDRVAGRLARRRRPRRRPRSSALVADRHVLGERRDRGVPVGLVAALGASRFAARLLARLLAALSCTSSGVAMKIEEYAPAAMPTNSASARSFSEPEPSWTTPT